MCAVRCSLASGTVIAMTVRPCAWTNQRSSQPQSDTRNDFAHIASFTGYIVVSSEILGQIEIVADLTLRLHGNLENMSLLNHTHKSTAPTRDRACSQLARPVPLPES